MVDEGRAGCDDLMVGEGCDAMIAWWMKVEAWWMMGAMR